MRIVGCGRRQAISHWPNSQPSHKLSVQNYRKINIENLDLNIIVRHCWDLCNPSIRTEGDCKVVQVIGWV